MICPHCGAEPDELLERKVSRLQQLAIELDQRVSRLEPRPAAAPRALSLVPDGREQAKVSRRKAHRE